MILQKEIECIAGKEENIIVPHRAIGKSQAREHPGELKLKLVKVKLTL